MDTATIDLIADAVAQRLKQPLVTDHILTRAEAMRYTKCRSHAAFTAWTKRWAIRPDARGRWSRAKLDLTLAREAGTTHTPAALRRNERTAA